MSITFILGGARSGKSKRAEFLAKESGLPVHYVATSPEMDDDEWSDRILLHQKQRPNSWKTIEEPLDLSSVLSGKPCIVVDCLTLWLSNVMFAKLDIKLERDKLCESLQACEGDVILVSNEIGMGLVPEYKLGRVFRDELGLLNQDIAEVADHVEFVAAGLSLKLK